MAAAAAEAPRSSSSGGGGGGGGSADSYIGSLISLTSKSEIRYEGVLYNIDTQDSTIGLQNVRSFGTEGRKKDGPQVPPSDKVYEYILFRGSDIKDLQVKSSPPVQTATPLHNDPAIIQSHYPPAATTPTGLSSGTISLTDPGAHSSSLSQPRPIYQGTVPPYQSGSSLGSWGSSPAPPTTNGTGLAMPMYWQGYYGPSGGMQAQQQALLRTPIGLPVPPSMQQPMQYPAADAPNFLASQLSENPPLLLPPFSTGTTNVQPSLLSEPANLIPEKSSVQTLSAASLTSNMPMASTLTATSDRSAIASLGSDKSLSVPDHMMPSKSMSEPPSSIAGSSSSFLKEAAMAPLVTPGQFLQPATTTVSLSLSSQTAQKDVEVVQVTSQQSLTTSMAATEAQEPILPLPSPPERKFYRGSTHTYRGGRGGRERGRGNEISRSATRFTEDFDFTAMNEKFNKDEVWGHLGKSNRVQEDGDNSHDEDDIGPSKPEVKPVYVKDDFFDSLSCDALNGGRWNGRARISQLFKRDSETFGEFSRHRGGRGGWGPGRGGRSHVEGYHGRGSYGYTGRGRGYNMPSRAQ